GTHAVAEAFTERAACLVRQFDAYVAVGDQHVNGKLTLGENIADQGGLKLAYAAYRGTRGSATITAQTGTFTAEQQFFLSFAQSWCTKRRPDLERLLANIDPHSPPRDRVNGAVANLEAFAPAFSCPASSLIARKSKRPFSALEARSYVLLQRAARRRVRNREEVEHELGNGIRRCEIRRLDLRGNGLDQHLIRLAAPLLKLAGK